MKEIIIGQDVLKTLADRGYIPKNCRRIILDINTEAVGTLYFESTTDKEVIDILLPDTKPAKIISKQKKKA